METTLLGALFIALMVGLASGSIGAFIILKRMALVGDAFSHVALPGIALALALRLDPLWGVIIFLLGAATLVWWFEKKTMLPTEGLVGLLFVASLAIGILTIPNTEIIESLFGEFPSMSFIALGVFLGLASFLILLSYLLTRHFTFFTISHELASVEGIGNKSHLVFLLIFALIVSLGVKLVGTLLMGALTIIPALIAKNLTRTMRSYMILSSFLGASISVLGVIISKIYGLMPGPSIVLLGLLVFLISLPLAKIHRESSKLIKP